jgi:adenylate cyclase
LLNFLYFGDAFMLFSHRKYIIIFAFALLVAQVASGTPRQRLIDSLTNQLAAATSSGDNGAVLSTVALALADAFSADGQYPMALQHYRLALAAAQRGNSKKDMVIGLGRMSGYFQRVGKVDSALAFATEALTLCQQLSDDTLMVHTLLTVGKAELASGNYTSLILRAWDAIALSEKIGKPLLGAKAKLLASNGYYLMATTAEAAIADGLDARLPKGNADQLKLAIEFALSASREATNPDAIELCRDSYSLLADAYAATKQFKESLSNREKCTMLNDSIAAEAHLLAVQQDATERAYSRRLMQDSLAQAANVANQQKRAERQWRYAYLGGAATLLLLVGILLLWKSKRDFASARQSSERKLRHMLPEPVAEELQTKGGVAPVRYADATVIWVACSGAPLGNNEASLKQYALQIDSCFKRIDALLGSYQLERIKTVGADYIAVCGLPLVHPSHGIEAVRFARAILAIDQSLSETEAASTLNLCIGIATGEVTAGIVGRKKWSYDIMGSVVNTAAQLAQLGTEHTLIISEATYPLVSETFYCSSYRQHIEENGDEVQYYRVESEV